MKLNAILFFSLIGLGLGLATPVIIDGDEKSLVARGNNTVLDTDGTLEPHPRCDANGDCPRYFGCRNGWCWCLPYHSRDCQPPKM
ncbi:hypothetical protein CNMCM5793_003311 [Aspergillus hiratsukae]|uniref:Uncharacterized protein n=1 Tax=Aspergillus hiratsukae TaxID=1194566 RepID=A0A8H6PEC3_9EURO|nr:hypothetical protein CNMCM5793_003311 [Aspergillus hiratsukae]KAF7169826.1 hypothetical protein CNMCM6106_004729 [Aspergillus hiratsukae]